MQPPVDQRRKIRVTGKESVVDVARIVFKDPRLATLIGDLNPALPHQGAIPPDTVVTCPSKTEAMVFAKKMGFNLGFDEKGTNGTRQKRAWAKLQGPGQASHAGIDPADAARQMLGQKLAVAEIGKRLVKLCTPERIDAFLAGDVDATLTAVQQATRVHSDFPKARARLTNTIAVIDATLRPAGMLALLEAHVDDATHAAAVMTAVLAPASAKAAVAGQAKRVTTLVGRARELIKIERGARDATFASDSEGVALQALCAALVDRVEPVSGERLKLLGLDDAHTQLSAHLLKLKEMLKKHDELLPRSGGACISTLAHGGDGGALPKPWPLVAAVIRGLKDPIDQAPVQARDLGLGGLVTHHHTRVTTTSPTSGAAASPTSTAIGTSSMEGGPVVSAASMQARAASGAKSVDEGTAIADRLAASVCELVALARPVVGDAGPAPMRRAKRRAHFDDVVVARGAPQGDAIARLVDELFADARRTNHAGVERVQRAQQMAARDIAKLLAGTITVHQKNISELGRAIVVVTCAIDRELGSLLLRPTGREAFRGAVERHAGKLLSKASLVFAEPPRT